MLPAFRVTVGRLLSRSPVRAGDLPIEANDFVPVSIVPADMRAVASKPQAVPITFNQVLSQDDDSKRHRNTTGVGTCFQVIHSLDSPCSAILTSCGLLTLAVIPAEQLYYGHSTAPA